jgi:hypothetical protein
MFEGESDVSERRFRQSCVKILAASFCRLGDDRAQSFITHDRESIDEVLFRRKMPFAVRRGLPPVRGLVRAMTNAGCPVLPARLLPRAAVLGADYRGGRDGGEGFTQRILQCCPGSHAADQWA